MPAGMLGIDDGVEAQIDLFHDSAQIDSNGALAITRRASVVQ
jgi:hypothetical protein